MINIVKPKNLGKNAILSTTDHNKDCDWGSRIRSQHLTASATTRLIAKTFFETYFQAADPLKIVHMTDIHYNPTNSPDDNTDPQMQAFEDTLQQIKTTNQVTTPSFHYKIN